VLEALGAVTFLVAAIGKRRMGLSLYFGLKVFMDARMPVTHKEGDRYPLRPPRFRGIHILGIMPALHVGQKSSILLSSTNFLHDKLLCTLNTYSLTLLLLTI